MKIERCDRDAITVGFGCDRSLERGSAIRLVDALHLLDDLVGRSFPSLAALDPGVLGPGKSRVEVDRGIAEDMGEGATRKRRTIGVLAGPDLRPERKDALRIAESLGQTPGQFRART